MLLIWKKIMKQFPCSEFDVSKHFIPCSYAIQGQRQYRY
jgi:hypothetical protein